MKRRKQSSKIKNKIIVITGGTGSFGNSVVAELLTHQPKQIIIVSRDEKKQFDMRNKYNNRLLRFIVGDVRDRESLIRVFEDVPVDYIFHAAALKQVPTAEFFPLEAIKTNILGAENVFQIALRYKVKKVVILSTDKAAYPINAMGMTKALMEKLMIAYSRDYDHTTPRKTIFCGVRYGNVLYSRGSVVPFFVALIKKDSPITITNPEMTRFLLPLTDAVDLVMHAFSSGKNGHMYVRKAPAATIDTLAQSVCKIFNYKSGYKHVGVRSGEKMHETLVTQEEMMRVKESKNYYEVVPETQGLDYNQYFYKGHQSAENLAYTSNSTSRLTVDETVKLLLSLPEIKKELKDFPKISEKNDTGVYTKMSI